MARQILGRRPYRPTDASARTILEQAPTRIDAGYVDRFDRVTGTMLASYGLRMVVLAMRERHPDRLRSGLLAMTLAAAVYPLDDRDLMVRLAIPHAVADRLGLAPAELFRATADRFEDGWLPTLLRVFGARTDVTLAAFGWRQVTTPEGLDIIADQRRQR